MLHTLLLLYTVATLHYIATDKVKTNRRRQDRIFRPLVPQLLPNYTAPSLPPPNQVSCNHASLACTYRAGCGAALHQYRGVCGDLVGGLTNTCSTHCRLALIALISTKEGERLMQCTCDDNSCILQKTRVEPCRSEVTWNIAPGTVVSCSVATWICSADPLCSTSLHYYNNNCKEMFRGSRCSKRCRNSLDILMRQKAADKLTNCYCDGTEEFECENIRENTNTLCLEKNKDTGNVTIAGDDEQESKGMMNTSSLLVIVSMLCSVLNTSLGESVLAFIQTLKFRS